MSLLYILILFQVQMEDVKDQGDEELYAKLDAAYSSDEEDMEVSTMNYHGHNKKILYVESY